MATIRTAEPPPQIYARVAGALYLVIIVGGIFAEFAVRSSLVVDDDAAETVENILDAEWLFRLAFATDLVVVACDVALALLFYVLLRPVNRDLALLAAFFRLTEAAVLAVNSLNHFAALVLLSGADYLDALEPDELNTLVLFFLEAHTFGYDIALVFFGVNLAVLGYLVYRSGYLPAVLGILLVVAAAGYVIDSFTSFLVPELDAEIVVVLVPAFVAEISLCLWLLLKGVGRPAAGSPN